MAIHLRVVAVDVHHLPAFTGQLDGELEREAVGRGEGERLLAGDRFLAREILEQPHPALERSPKRSSSARTTRSISVAPSRSPGTRLHLADHDRG